MKRYVFVCMLAMLLCGCSGLRKTVVVTHATHDTMYFNRIQYDSVYIDRWRVVDRLNDTVFVCDTMREYRYKMFHDTVRVSQIDSVPIVHEIEIVKSERYVPKSFKWVFVTCIFLIITIIAVVAIRIIRHVSCS